MNSYWGTLLTFNDQQFRTLLICPFMRDINIYIAQDSLINTMKGKYGIKHILTYFELSRSPACDFLFLFLCSLKAVNITQLVNSCFQQCSFNQTYMFTNRPRFDSFSNKLIYYLGRYCTILNDKLNKIFYYLLL